MRSAFFPKPKKFSNLYNPFLSQLSMVIYSHSKIKTFEQCPLRYKYKYLDKIPEPKETIEAYLGKVVHSVLEWLYTKLKEKSVPNIDELINYYLLVWEKNYSDDLLIVRKEFSHKYYFEKGVEYLLSYYRNNFPFDKNTLELEKKILIELDEKGIYKIQGFIDRLAFNLETNQYEIHDYKTANSLPSKEQVEKDRQLALYSIAIKELFGHEKEVILIWHYLAHNQKIISKRTNEQLQNLKKETLELIEQIEATKKFPPYISKLCDWCGYKSICPAWGNHPPKQTTLKDFKVNGKEEDELDIL